MNAEAVNDGMLVAPRAARRLATALAVGLLVLATAAPARAGITQFARFGLTTGTPFTFTYGTTSATFTASTNVSFEFVNLSGVPTGPQDATLTLNSSTKTPASTLGSVLIQPLDQLSTLSIIRNSDHANLLTVQFTGTLTGTKNTDNVSLGSSTDTGNTVKFTSDFALHAPLLGSTNLSMQLLLQPVSPLLSQGASGFLNSFTTNGSGTFVGPNTVPEPSSYVLISTGLFVGALAAARRRRAA